MLKVSCPDCLQTFIWTDSMPFKGKCPTIDCEWTYDIHQELKKSVRQREDDAGHVIRCPHCHEIIDSKVTICKNCDEIIVGAKYFEKKYLLYIIAALLIILSLIYKFR